MPHASELDALKQPYVAMRNMEEAYMRKVTHIMLHARRVERELTMTGIEHLEHKETLMPVYKEQETYVQKRNAFLEKYPNAEDELNQKLEIWEESVVY